MNLSKMEYLFNQPHPRIIGTNLNFCIPAGQSYPGTIFRFFYSVKSSFGSYPGVIMANVKPDVESDFQKKIAEKLSTVLVAWTKVPLEKATKLPEVIATEAATGKYIIFVLPETFLKAIKLLLNSVYNPYYTTKNTTIV